MKHDLRALIELDQILNNMFTYRSIAPIITISTVFRVVDFLCSGQGEQAKSEFHILNLCLIRHTDLYTGLLDPELAVLFFRRSNRFSIKV